MTVTKIFEDAFLRHTPHMVIPVATLSLSSRNVFFPYFLDVTSATLHKRLWAFNILSLFCSSDDYEYDVCVWCVDLLCDDKNVQKLLCNKKNKFIHSFIVES